MGAPVPSIIHPHAPFGHQVNLIFCLWAVTHGLDLCDPLPTSLVEEEPGVGTNAHERELQNSQ